MPRFNLYNLSLQEQRELLDRFFMAITALVTFDEVKNFFRDLLNPQETVMLARRLKAAEMLFDKDTYDEIARKLKMGPGTVAKVHRWVNSGKNGYKIAVKRIKKLDKRELRKAVKESKALEYGWERFKKVYPTFDLENVNEFAEAIEDYVRRRKRKKSLKKSTERKDNKKITKNNEK